MLGAFEHPSRKWTEVCVHSVSGQDGSDVEQMQHTLILTRRDAKHTINFRDDLSEYSSPSSWGDGPGPLSLSDHRLAAEGLQAKRTVGEALLRAQWERQCEADAEACNDACACLGARAARLCRVRLRRSRPRPAVLFSWSEVQSLVLLPYDPKGPYLIAINTFRLRETGTGEWLMQAASLRDRARWGIEMMAAILRDRKAGGSPVNAPCSCCGAGRTNGLSLALFMDVARVACEVARLQPSAGGMQRLIEVLDLLVESGSSGPGTSMQETSQPSTIFVFPLAGLRRFGDATRRAYADFEEWQWWREVSKLLRPPHGWDASLWQGRVLPFVWPRDASLRDPHATVYPAMVDIQLANAAERYRRTLS